MNKQTYWERFYKAIYNKEISDLKEKIKSLELGIKILNKEKETKK